MGVLQGVETAPAVPGIEYKAAATLDESGLGVIEQSVVDPFEFSIIGSVTGVLDEVNDVIEPGAFAATLQKRKPKIIKDHDWAKRLGRVLDIEELLPGDPRLPKTTADGKPWPGGAGALIAKVRLFKETAEGKAAAERWREDGPASQFSIGYTVPAGGATKDKIGVRYIKTLDCYEISDVLWGAMPLAGMLPGELATKVLAGVAAGDSDVEDVEPPVEVESKGDCALLDLLEWDAEYDLFTKGLVIRWESSKHPRDHGKFASKPGGSGVTLKPRPARGGGLRRRIPGLRRRNQGGAIIRPGDKPGDTSALSTAEVTTYTGGLPGRLKRLGGKEMRKAQSYMMADTVLSEALLHMSEHFEVSTAWTWAGVMALHAGIAATAVVRDFRAQKKALTAAPGQMEKAREDIKTYVEQLIDKGFVLTDDSWRAIVNKALGHIKVMPESKEASLEAYSDEDIHEAMEVEGAALWHDGLAKYLPVYEDVPDEDAEGKSAWAERLHPRDHGKFSSKPGSGGIVGRALTTSPSQRARFASADSRKERSDPDTIAHHLQQAVGARSTVKHEEVPSLLSRHTEADPALVADPKFIGKVEHHLRSRGITVEGAPGFLQRLRHPAASPKPKGIHENIHANAARTPRVDVNGARAAAGLASLKDINTDPEVKDAVETQPVVEPNADPDVDPGVEPVQPVETPTGDPGPDGTAPGVEPVEAEAQAEPETEPETEEDGYALEALIPDDAWDDLGDFLAEMEAEPAGKAALLVLEAKYDTSPTGTPGGKPNWVDKAGGFPPFLRAVIHALKRNGKTEGNAIQIAMGSMRRWASGAGDVTAKTRAKAAQVVAWWEAHTKGDGPGNKGLEDDLADLVGPEYPFLPGSVEESASRLRKALAATLLPEEGGHVEVIGTYGDVVFARAVAIGGAEERTVEVPYDLDEHGSVMLGDPQDVEVSITTGTEPVDLAASDLPGGVWEGLDLATVGMKGLVDVARETKAGRVLSSQNAKRLQSAVENLVGVLRAAGVDITVPDMPNGSAVVTDAQTPVDTTAPSARTQPSVQTKQVHPDLVASSLLTWLDANATEVE